MKSSVLAQLAAVCPPPSQEPSVKGFEDFMRGRDAMWIPPGYDSLIRRYGAGRFDDFLAIYSPGHANRYLDILYWTETSREIMSRARVPALRAALEEYSIRPEELIQWGGTDNADSLFWIPSDRQGEWPTVIVAAGQLNFSIVPNCSTEAILGLVTGSLRCDFFPDDFPSQIPEFVRAE
jgi:hypothetical protein